MKKSLLALAVLGTFGGIAAAQTSVTLYGIVDANISRFEAGDKAAPGTAGTTVVRMNDGTTNGINGSRWGLRGSEDLGGGTRAIFTLESGFNIDTGNSAQGGRLFGRQAFLGVVGSFGQVTLGRQQTPTWLTMAIADPFGQGQVGNVAGGFSTGRTDLPLFIAPATNSASLGGVRNDNSVNYRTPNFDGFVADFQYRLGETVGNVSRGRMFNVSTTYTSGPLSVGAAYQQEKTVATGATRNKVTMVVGSFDLGVARLHAGIQSNRDLEVPTTLDSTGLLNKHTVYTVGATVPLAPFTLLANYTSAKFEDPNLVNNTVAPTREGTVGKFALGAQYNLSRRSILYTGFAVATGDFKDNVTEKTAVNVGVRHAF